MSKGNGFFSNLKKSTKITLVSCGCFIAMTALILFFFVMFPITPSEKIISSIGRESISKKDPNASGSATTTVNTTTVNTTTVTKKARTTTSPSKTTKSDYVITITSGSGFYRGQKIPSGGYPNENYYTPTTSTIADGGYTGGGNATGGYTGGISNGGGTSGSGNTTGGYTGGTTGGGNATGGETPAPVEGGNTTGGETPAPVEGGNTTGGETPAPVDSGNTTGGDTPAPVDGGGAAAPAAE